MLLKTNTNIRTIAVALGIIIGIFITPIYAKGQNSLTLPDVQVEPNKTGIIGLSLINQDAVASGEINFTYNSSIGFNITDVKLTSRTVGFTKSFNQDKTDPKNVEVKVLFYSMEETVIASGNGDILEFGYQTAGTGTGSTSLTFSETILSNQNGDSLQVTLKNGNVSFGGQPVLSVTPDSAQNIPASSGKLEFSVSNTGTGTMNWSVKSDQSWLTVSPSSGKDTGTVTANYTANTGTSSRTATITFTATGATGSPKTVQVTQAGIKPVISGSVKDSAGNGISAVTMTFSNNGGSVTTDSSGYYSQSVSSGWSGTVTPSKTGYTFTPVNRTYTNVTSNRSDQDYSTGGGYTLTKSSSPSSGGTISVSPDKSVYNSGESVTLTAKPASCYEFANWSGDSSGTGTTVTLVMNSDKSVTANFKTKTVTVSGYVRDSANTGISGVTLSFSSGVGSVTTNTSGYYTQTVNCNWSGTVTPSKAGYTFTPVNRTYTNVTSNRSDQDYSTGGGYTLTKSSSPSSGGTISVSPDKTVYNSGESVTLTATPASCYEFANWSGDSSGTGTTVTLVMNSDKSVTANFKSKTVTVSGYVRNSANTGISGVTLSFSSGVGSVTTNTSGYYTQTVNCNWSGTVTPSKTGCTFTPANKPYSNVTSAQTNQHYTGNCCSSSNYTLTATAGTGGTISPSSATVNCGESKTFTIKPNTGYSVSTFTDNGIDKKSALANNQYSLTNIRENHTIAVSFSDCSSSHFIPVWTGNPYNSMTLWVFNAGIQETECDEIAVFDGNICVGSGIVKDIISEQNPLAITLSQDDGTGNGFTEGSKISFRFWDADHKTEYTNIRATFMDSDGNPVFPPPTFKGNTDYEVSLEPGDIIPQTIPLTKGWNIISSYVFPEYQDMTDIFQPLITSDVLEKVIDERGSRLLRFFGNWMNMIGDFDHEEGYKVKVSNDTELTITGSRIQPPTAIRISEGWNIISYPCTSPQNAMNVVQPLIDSGKLVKVIDEKGNRIINLYGKWINAVGDFIPGKGYQIKVNTDDCMIIDAPAHRKMRSHITSPTGKQTEYTYFKPVWTGNPNNPMNLWIIGADFQDENLSADDEIGVFDGENCVGVGIVKNEISVENPLIITLSQNDGQENGFIEGNEIRLILWDSDEQTEIPLIPDFTDMETGISLEPSPTFKSSEDYAVYLISDSENCCKEEFTLNDAISGLKTLSGINMETTGNADADKNAKIEIRDVLYVLQRTSGLR